MCLKERQPQSTQDTTTSNKLIWLPKDTKMCRCSILKKIIFTFPCLSKDTHDTDGYSKHCHCHHSTWMALKVKVLHDQSITSSEIHWYNQFDDRVRTFVLHFFLHAKLVKTQGEKPHVTFGWDFFSPKTGKSRSKVLLATKKCCLTNVPKNGPYPHSLR